MQQRDLELAGVGERVELVGGAALLVRQLAGGVGHDIGHRGALERIALVALLSQDDETALHEPTEDGGRHPPIAELRRRQAGGRGAKHLERRHLAWSQTRVMGRLNPLSRSVARV